jgi:hypothetical protein
MVPRSSPDSRRPPREASDVEVPGADPVGGVLIRRARDGQAARNAEMRESIKVSVRRGSVLLNAVKPAR